MSCPKPPTLWAFLVGIDHYPPESVGKTPSDLRGCVADIDAIQNTLKEIIKKPLHLEIVKITAPRQVDSLQLDPTHKNIKEKFGQIQAQAQKDDIVYFH